VRLFRAIAPRIFNSGVLALLAAGTCLQVSMRAQAPQLSPDASTLQGRSSQSSPTDISSQGPENSSSPGAGLSAAQIEAVLQDKPEVIVEIKQLVADQLQQQGFKIQADSITDEMLFNQIADSPTLRAGITNLLRARGYVSDADLQRGRTDSAESVDDPSPFEAQHSLARPTNVRPLSDDTMSAVFAEEASARDKASLGNSRALEGSPAPQATKPSSSNSSQQRDVESHNTTDVPQVLRQPAPYNLRSMRDLYTQIPEQAEHLKRFGSEMFVGHAPSSAQRIPGQSPASAVELPLDVPVGPDYVVGPGDSLTIDVWGGISQTLTRVIDREGKISLPEAGTVQVAGLSLRRAQALIEGMLKQQYRNAQVAVTIAHLRTVRVYVVGDVQRPGAYDISSLSSPVNALYDAGGPTAVGSLRTLRHLRGNMLVAEIDLYDFLLHGMRSGDDRFQGGDTLLVPPAGPQVAVSGAVKRPAIYELKADSNLMEVLEDAGGASVAAALGHITIERIDANKRRETVRLMLPEGASPEEAKANFKAFVVKDGDRVHVSQVLPFSERAVYLEGHVVRPGRLAYHDGLQLNEVLKSYQDLLPEPATQGEIIRLVAPDLHAETIEFDLADVLIGNSSIALRPFDTIRVLGRYEVDAPRVTVRGEVLRPGVFPLSAGMTAGQLVLMAGGFKRDALQQDADLTSYHVVDGSRVVGQRSAVRIGDAVSGNDRTADVALKPGDILTVHQITGWNDIGNSVTIEGEANHPGSYGFQEGERLSSVLRRAGGFRDTAYPDGAVLIRQQVRLLEEKSRAELIHQIETTSAAARLSPNLTSTDSSSTLQLIQQQQEQVLARLRSQPASGRLVIHISSDINSWANTDADIEVRQGDVLSVPKRPGFVLISGQVYNASAITFVPGKTAGWYLERAGGASEFANRKEIFVIRANGAVVGRRSGSWQDGHVLSTRLDPGDVVVVPQKIIGASQFWRNLLAVAQIASSTAITAVVAGL
jgi:protein involved in polysaccharide export with SLBB domain